MGKAITFVVGRFQPFHNAHLELVKHAIDEANGGYTIVFIGNSGTIDARNPFTYEQRASMVKKSLSEYTGLYCVKPLPDVPDDDMVWLGNITKVLDETRKHLKLHSALYKAVVCDKDIHTANSNTLFENIPRCKIVRIEDTFHLNATDIRKKIYLENAHIDMIDDIPNGTKQVLNKCVEDNPEWLKIKV